VKPSDDRLVELLNHAPGPWRNGRRVLRVTRQPGAYHSSHRLEDLAVALDDGTQVAVVFKDLSPGAMLDDAGRVRPAFLYNPAREGWAYDLLEHCGVDAPRRVAYHADPAAGEYFLFVEHAPGVPLWQVGDLAAWEAAARWLARTHGKLAAVVDSDNPDPLLCYTEKYLRLWPARAREFVPDPALARLVDRYDAVIERLMRLPTTVIHGEFVASNVLVESAFDGPRISVVDWEMAAVGPGLMDLADLTAGNWAQPERQAIVQAYRQAATPVGDFDAALDACRLHKAMQWLGWARDWQPPKEHRQDWLGEALRLGGKLGLV
jgi:hypothetical protein